MRKILYLICIAIFCFTLTYTEICADSFQERMTISAYSNQEIVFYFETPVHIFDDSDFTSYGFSGEGTSEQPYLIENLTMITDIVAITIFNTTKHFIVRNCLISSGSIGIHVDLVAFQTAIIENNYITSGPLDHCIAISYSSGAIIRDNICKNGMHGIGIYDSHSTIISNNTCINNNDDAINSYGSGNILIKNNYCTGSSLSGINLYNAGLPTIINNTCNYNNWHGISVSHSTSITVVNNTCSENRFSGIALAYSNGLVKNNTFADNNVGIRLSNSKQGNYTHNMIERNEGYGIYVSANSNNNIVHSNNFTDNNLGGSSQAYDSGMDNIWCDEINQIGNFWNDWFTDDPYPIDGTSGSFDPYPSAADRKASTSTTTISDRYFIFIISVLGAISYLKIRKKKNS